MRVLFTTQPGHGHLQPMAPYAQALAAAGEEVRVATAPGFCAAVEALGLEAVPAGVDFTWEQPTRRFPQLLEATSPAAMGEILRELLFDHWVPTMSEDLRPVLASWRPDLLVREAAEYAAVFLSQQHRIPCVNAAWGAVSTDPVWELNAVPMSVLRQEYRRRARTLGLPLDDADAYWAQELTLSSLPPSWVPEDLDTHPPVHHFRMPPLDGARGGEWAGPTDSSRPLVYATLGTVFGYDRELRSMLLEAFASLDAHVVMTVGRSVDPSRIAAPANVRIEQYVPQSLVLPQAAAVVSHAGLGTMIGAIAAGVPMVLVELSADHAVNASRAASIGIARTFRRDAVDAASLRAAIETVLVDPLPRSRSQALADEYALLPPPEAAVDVLRQHVRDVAGA